VIPAEPPIAGTVIRYAFLWSTEDRAGFGSGQKERPAVLVVARKPRDGSCIVVPITHREPEGRTVGVEIPSAICRSIGLDDRRQWVIVSEGNDFVWPGPDLRAIPELDPPTVVYGTVPRRFFALVLAHMQTLIRARRLAISPRR
jgi:uncharacterized protein YifN (PemK superfamily)